MSSDNQPVSSSRPTYRRAQRHYDQRPANPSHSKSKAPDRTMVHHPPHQPPEKLANQSKKSSRKQAVSMNHLLNFTLPPRQPQPHIIRRQKIRYEAYKKELFINANFRFILYPTCDVSKYLLNPDCQIDWQDIFQVIVSSHDDMNCSICLQTFSAPRVTKCGHIFCYHCILRYLLVTEGSLPSQQWRKCPICWEPVYKKDLTCVLILPEKFSLRKQSKDPSSHQIKMRLIRKPPNSTLCLPRNLFNTLEKDITFPSIAIEDASTFAKLILSTNDHMLKQFNNDIDSLFSTLQELKAYDDYQSENFILDTITVIQSRRALLENPESSVKTNLLGSNSKDQPTFRTPPPKVQNDVLKDYLFYQAEDGQHIYLHPLDIRILKHEYGDFESFPDIIEAPVLSYQETTITPDLRRKFKYLSHIPIRCDITFVEIELKKIVSRSTLHFFKDQLKKRTNERLKKERRPRRQSPSPNPSSFESPEDYPLLIGKEEPTAEPVREEKTPSSSETPPIKESLSPAATSSQVEAEISIAPSQPKFKKVGSRRVLFSTGATRKR